MSETATKPITTSDHDVEHLKKKAVDAGHAVADLASEARHFASGKLGEGKECLAEKIGKSKESVHNFIVREPYKAIAIAAGVGLLVGYLIKRR